MKFEAVTIKDIAKALGLSTSTVSRALRDSHEIGQETKDRVRALAEKLGFHEPVENLLKRSLGSAKTNPTEAVSG